MTDIADQDIINAIKKTLIVQHASLEESMHHLEEAINIRFKEFETRCMTDVMNSFSMRTNTLKSSLVALDMKLTHLENLLTIKNEQANDYAEENDITPFYKRPFIKYGSIFVIGCILTAFLSSLWVKYETNRILTNETFTKTSVGAILMHAWPTLTTTEKEKIVKKGWDDKNK